jgi:hypothetical protein
MNSIEDLIKNVSSISYKGNLNVVRVVRSVNCKEWEKQKESNNLSLEASSKMAFRCYVTQNFNDYSHHAHEGHIDFRPSLDSSFKLTVSDAFLPIPNDDYFYVTCKKIYRSDDPFNPVIETVPYTIPDFINFLCSPSALWIMLRTLSVEFGKEYISLFDINSNLPSFSRGNSVGIKEYIPFFSKYDYEPSFYSGNKKIDFYENVKKKIACCKGDACYLDHFYKIVRGTEDGFSDTVLDSSLLYSYIESGIPVYLVFETNDLIAELGYEGQSNDTYHAVVAIGHTLDENSCCTHFIIHDVSYAPFVKISKEFVDNHLLEALVLLPQAIRLRPEYFLPTSTCRHNAILEKIFKVYSIYDARFLESSNIKIRPFFRRSQDIKFWFSNPNLYNEKIKSIFENADFPTYVWVIEIKTNDIKDGNQCIGHIIFDATLSEGGLILINLPRFRLWFEDKNRMVEYPDIDTFESFPIFKAPFK